MIGLLREYWAGESEPVSINNKIRMIPGSLFIKLLKPPPNNKYIVNLLNISPPGFDGMIEN
jgi:hypothetical protein